MDETKAGQISEASQRRQITYSVLAEVQVSEFSQCVQRGYIGYAVLVKAQTI